MFIVRGWPKGECGKMVTIVADTRRELLNKLEQHGFDEIFDIREVDKDENNWS